ncbi:MAG: hypothetical protein QOG90_145, partial [Actinomycetota bacterium]
MSPEQRSLSDMTLGDIGRGLKRYQPFAIAVLAIVLVVAFLPGKQHPVETKNADGTTGLTETGGDNGGTTGVTTADGALADAGGSGGTGVGGNSVNRANSDGGSAPPKATADKYCDPATGRLKIPTLYAPPCLPTWPGGSNGGATSLGVNADTITIAVPYGQPNPAGQAILAAAGDTDTQDQINKTTSDWFNFFQHHFQTYGRKINPVFFQSNVNPNDSQNPAAQNSEAQADAIHVAKEIKAFASLGDAGDPSAYHDTLAANHVICICTTTNPASWYLKRAPYLWGNGLPDETQDYDMRAEMICDEIAPYAPKWFGGSTNGEARFKTLKKRKFALISPTDPAGTYKDGHDFFVQKLKECGVTFGQGDDVTYPLTDIVNAAQAQQDAQTFAQKFSLDGVSTVIFVGDPITPVYFTGAATQQQYFPEWIQMGSALTDTATFARVYDQQQWVHNFGFSALGDRLPNEQTNAYLLYHWQFGKDPDAVSTSPITFASVQPLMLGITLAGPNLTPTTFKCGAPPYTSKTVEGDGCV